MVKLYLGGYSSSIQGEPNNPPVPRMFSAAHKPGRWGYDRVAVPPSILDSGAFTDKPSARLSPDRALDRQIAWERRASELWEREWKAYALVSYDLLIDETWVGETKHKRRWDIKQAEWAVEQTIAAARFIAAHRTPLLPRRLILSAQGVDAIQYEECAIEILKTATPDDIFGLGGWCIIGMMRRYLPIFWQAMHLVIPRIAAAGIRDVHIFGVLYEPALAGLLWLCDTHGLTLSTDSGKPIMDCICKTDTQRRKAGARAAYWKDNMNWWIDHLQNLRTSRHYHPPPETRVIRQNTLF